MVPRQIARSCVIGAIALLVSAQPALAVDPTSEFAVSWTLAPGPVYDGLKGNMNIRTDPATVANVAYVHPTQVDVGSVGGDFIAIGTANGVGVDHCANDYDPAWSGYYDGTLGELYFCYDFDLDAYHVGSNPTFKIYYETGALCGGNRWILQLNGITRACLTGYPASGQGLYVGLETASNPFNPTDRNIDVKYTNLKRNQTNGTDWRDLGTQPQWNIWPNYSATLVSGTAQNFYLAPLD